jgi:hypothetical protein
MCAMCYDEEEGTNETDITLLTDKHEYDEDETFTLLVKMKRKIMREV